MPSEARILLIVVIMLFPVMKIIFGAILAYKTPSLNWVFGYRTPRSMKNDEAWLYANKLAGKIWLVMGPIEIMIFIPLVILFEDITLYLIITFLPLVLTIIMMIVIEFKLRKINNKLK